MIKVLKIVADENIPYLRGVLEPYADVRYIAGGKIAASDLSEAEVLVVRTRTRCNRALLEGSAVRTIYTATIGFDHIDTDYCRKAGIEVVTCAGCNARGVLQWVGAVLSTMSRRYGWSPEEKTLGVVGVGNVGSIVADYAQRWGFRVMRCDPPRARTEGADGFYTFEEVAARADIFTFHVPLNPTGADATYHMAGRDFFSKIAPGALVINSSRGEVVDTDALTKAVAGRGIRCAIDTWEGEPDVDADLAGIAEIATTHIAGYSAQGKANATAMIVNAIAGRYGFPISDWYPSEVNRPAARPISWAEMRETITNYCDLERETEALRRDITRFEQIRNEYNYRQEYF